MPRRQVPTPFTPNPVPVPAPTTTSMNIDRNRSNIYQFTSNDSVAGRYLLNGIDQFYLKCQKHRDFFKDLTGQFQPSFYIRTKQFSTRPDPTSVYLKIPTSRFAEPKPVTYPQTMGRRGLNSLKTRFE